MMHNRVSDLISRLLVAVAVAVIAAVGWRALATEPSTSGIGIQVQPIPDVPELASGGRPIADAEGGLRVTVFTDFLCPYCAELHETLREIQRLHPERVHVIYRFLPGPARAHAMDAALAAECAAAENRFSSFAQLAFEHEANSHLHGWTAVAEKAGVANRGALEECMRSESAKRRILDDVRLAHRIGVTATPSMVVDNELIVGAVPREALERWIRARHPGVLLPLTE